MIQTALFVVFILGIALVASAVWLFISRKMPARRKPSRVLVYHRVENHFVAGTTWQTSGQFRRHIAYLSQKGYQGVKLEKNVSDPAPKEVAIVFDDALECVYKNAVPALVDHQFSACFFVVSAYMGKTSGWDVYKQPHMTKDQIRELDQQGFEIGSHTHTHVNLARVSPERVKEELSVSKGCLEDLLGKPVEYLSLPFGRYNEKVLDIARVCGYKGAVTINHPLLPSSYDSFVIPGNAVYLFDRLDNVESKASGRNLYWMELLKNKMVNRFATGTSLVIPQE